jgi:hypothetical protein
MSFANPNVSDIIATTIQSRTGRIADNVTYNNALLSRLRQRGNVRPFSGGNVILQELSFAQNANAGWYSGYETLPINAQDVISAAQYDIKQAAVPVTMSGLEMLQNAGKEQIIDLMEARLKVAESTMANLVSNGLYSDGTGSSGKELTGLKAAVPLVGNTGTYGGIDRATYTFWQNKYVDSGSALTASTIQAAYNSMWASLVRGSDRPDLIVVSNAHWAAYMASLQAIQRFSNESSMAKLGFTTVKFMDADVVLDGGIGGYAPAGFSYFLNTNYIFFRPHRDRNFVALDPNKRYSVNQDAVVQILAFAGNLTCSGTQFQGVISD